MKTAIKFSFLAVCVIYISMGIGGPSLQLLHGWPNRPDEVIDFVKPLLPVNPIVFEAGAYDGTDTIRMAKAWPQGRIYAFEPVSENYMTLKGRIKGFHNIAIFPAALSDKNGISTFYVSEYHSAPGRPGASGSLLAPQAHTKYDKEIVFPRQTEVTTLTVDNWAHLHNVLTVDFMWLDMQGHELTMLKHAGSILPTVKLIYMEVEFIEAYAGQPIYRDIKSWMEANGFEVLALDFDEEHAARCDKIQSNEQWFGNALFISKKYRQEIFKK